MLLKIIHFRPHGSPLLTNIVQVVQYLHSFIFLVVATLRLDAWIQTKIFLHLVHLSHVFQVFSFRVCAVCLANVFKSRKSQYNSKLWRPPRKRWTNCTVLDHDCILCAHKCLTVLVYLRGQWVQVLLGSMVERHLLQLCHPEGLLNLLPPHLRPSEGLKISLLIFQDKQEMMFQGLLESPAGFVRQYVASFALGKPSALMYQRRYFQAFLGGTVARTATVLKCWSVW